MQEPLLEPLLEELGLNENQIKVYVGVLQNGKITPAQLASLTGINRTTVYSIAKELIKLGVITEDLGGKTRYLVALPPQELENIFRKEERELAEKRHFTQQAIKQLEQITQNTKYSIPKIVFITEEDIQDYLYKQTPRWNESLSERDGVWWGFQAPSFVESYQSWIDWYWQEANPEDVSLKLLTSQSDIEAEMAKRNYERRQIKFWTESKEFTSTIWVNGDYVIMITTDNHPYSLVEIHDKALAHNLRELFKGIWESLK